MLLLTCAFVLLASLGLTWIATGLMLRILLRLRLVDRANDRSSHAYCKIIGGGWALYTVIVFFMLLLANYVGEMRHVTWLLLGLTFVAMISWLDDLRALGAQPRFLVQILAVACGLLALPDNDVFGAYIPHWLEQGLTVLGWLWFLNLYNFMDGLDGMTGTQTGTLGIAILGLCCLVVLPPIIPLTATLLIGVALGWLCWNWAPARLFMGDIGSVSLGFFVGWLLLYVAKSGYVVAAAIPILYYGTDTTWTLLRRIVQKKPFWHAHREHFFHQALAGTGDRHQPVVLRLLVANLALLPCVAIAVEHGAWALLPAGTIVLGLIADYKRLSRYNEISAAQA